MKRATILLIGAMVLVALAPATFAQAAENAARNGSAIASGAYVPLQVDPNVQAYPAYAAVDVDDTSSHGFGGGIYPGFLAHASAEFYGFGPEERSSLGISESQWPNPPRVAKAAASDLGDKCRFLVNDFMFPSPVENDCKTYWSRTGGSFPGEEASSTTRSAPGSSIANATAQALGLPQGLSIGSSETESSTRIVHGAVVSHARAVLSDIAIGPLHVASIVSDATATTNGHRSSVTRSVVLTEPTIGGAPVSVTDQGVLSNAGRSLDTLLATYGFHVSLIDGESVTHTTDAGASSGGLLVELTQHSAPPAAAADVCAKTADAQKSQATLLKQLTGKDELYHVHVSQPDPLCDASDDDIRNGTCSHRKPFTALPATIEEDQPVPALVPCLALLLQRDVNAGIALASTVATARVKPLPAPPTFVPPKIPVFRIPLLTLPAPIEPVQAPTLATPPAIAPAGEVRFIPGSDGLGTTVAHRVRALYGAVVLFGVIVFIGRGRFRSLTRT